MENSVTRGYETYISLEQSMFNSQVMWALKIKKDERYAIQFETKNVYGPSKNEFYVFGKNLLKEIKGLTGVDDIITLFGSVSRVQYLGDEQ